MKANIQNPYLVLSSSWYFSAASPTSLGEFEPEHLPLPPSSSSRTSPSGSHPASRSRPQQQRPRTPGASSRRSRCVSYTIIYGPPLHPSAALHPIPKPGRTRSAETLIARSLRFRSSRSANQDPNLETPGERKQKEGGRPL